MTSCSAISSAISFALFLKIHQKMTFKFLKQSLPKFLKHYHLEVLPKFLYEIMRKFLLQFSDRQLNWNLFSNFFRIVLAQVSFINISSVTSLNIPLTTSFPRQFRFEIFSVFGELLRTFYVTVPIGILLNYDLATAFSDLSGYSFGNRISFVNCFSNKFLKKMRRNSNWD